MAAPIYSYRPEIKVEILDNDITVNLGDVGSCTVRKNLYQPAGEFQLVFPDLPVAAWNSSGGEGPGAAVRESLYGLVNPLDKIVIWMRRWRDDCPTVEPWVPVLTGFVRSVGRDEQVGPDGRPRRQVVVAGQDCGAAFLMEMVSAWITFQNDGLAGPLPASLTWLRELGLDSRAIKVEDFMWQTATVATQSIMDAVGYQFQQKFYVNKGTVVPYSAFSQEGTIWEMLYRHTDPPWNEFFVRENRNMFPDMSVRCPGSAGDIHKKELLDPELVFRPTPWLDYDENPLPDVNMDSVTMWNIAMKNVVALRAHRDDSELVNHVQIKPTLLGGTGYTQVFQPDMGLVNADTRAKYGDRIQNDVTQLFPADLARPPINLPRADQLQAENVTKDWVTERRDWMVLAQNRIHDFERGSITMKGYPMMRVGDYFRLHRGDIIWHGYVTNIVHDYQPYRHYFTTMDYIRGSQIKVRREIQNPWDVERKTGT